MKKEDYQISLEKSEEVGELLNDAMNNPEQCGVFMKK